jgi:hypothetical protein
MEDLNALDFNMTLEMHAKNVSPMQEQEIDPNDPYVPILDHLMEATQVLESSQTQVLDVKNKIASNYDGTMGGRKRRKVDIKGRIPREKKFKAWWLQKWMKMMGRMF